MVMSIKTCGMLIWQILDGDFHSVNHGHDDAVLWIYVDISVKRQMRDTLMLPSAFAVGGLRNYVWTLVAFTCWQSSR